MRRLNLLQRIGIVGATALVIAGAGCSQEYKGVRARNSNNPNYKATVVDPGIVMETPKYNPDAYDYIKNTLKKSGTIKHPGESAAMDKTLKDFESGKIDVFTLIGLVRDIDVTISHPGEDAAFDRALKDLPKPY